MDSSVPGLPPGFNFIVPVTGWGEAHDELAGTVSLVGGELLWNVVVGCTGGSPICRDCAAKAYFGHWYRSTGYYVDADSWNTVIAYEYALTRGPARWPRDRSQRILVAPAGDLFHERVSDAFLDRVLSVMQQHPQHTFYIVTKRAERMKAYLASRASGILASESRRDAQLRGLQWPLPNVRVGISCEDQRTYLARVRHLVQTPAAKRFVVAEPLIGPIRMEQVPLETRDILWPLRGLVQAYLGQNTGGKFEWESLEQPLAVVGTVDWVVVGGYRGTAVRPLHPIWLRMIQRDCEVAGVPFHFKGWGDYIPVKQPELDQDASLVILSHDGTLRGRGAGSATNHLFLETQVPIPDLYMSRTANRELHNVLGGKRYQAMPNEQPRRVRLTDQSEVARMLQRLSNAGPDVAGPPTVNPSNAAQPAGADPSARTLADKMQETAGWLKDKLNTPLW